MNIELPQNTSYRRSAPWHLIPDAAIVSVEHPGMVKHVDKALATLGGDAKIENFLQSSQRTKSLPLYLRPEDKFRRPIMSREISTSNIIVKLTVPRRTGRKRKRGSQEAFIAESTDTTVFSGLGDPKHMLQSLRDNPYAYQLQTLGMVSETHRFRTLPDFQYSLCGHPLVDSIKQSILPFQYEKLKDFRIDLQTRGARPDLQMIPPPSLSQMNIPFNYAYHQNPAVKFIIDSTGKAVTVNTMAAQRVASQLVEFGVKNVPSQPLPGLTPEGQLEPFMQTLIKRLREVLERRPVATRRVLLNTLGREHEYDFRYAIQYTAYMFRSGPWRDSHVRLGVDPRTDPKYREYQTLMFKIIVKDGKSTWIDGRQRYVRSVKEVQDTDKTTHFFDGKKVVPDGKVWHLCDITDPLLREIIDGEGPRNTCDIKLNGWIHNGQLAKVHCIMRDKIQLLMAGIIPSDADYARLVKLPNIIDENNSHLAILSKNKTSIKEMELATEIRTMARSSYIKPGRGGKAAANSQKRKTAATENQSDDDEEVLNPDEAPDDVEVE